MPGHKEQHELRREQHAMAMAYRDWQKVGIVHHGDKPMPEPKIDYWEFFEQNRDTYLKAATTFLQVLAEAGYTP